MLFLDSLVDFGYAQSPVRPLSTLIKVPVCQIRVIPA